MLYTRGGQEVRKFFDKWASLYRTRIWCQIGVWFAILFMGMVLLFQIFLKREYYDYLMGRYMSMKSILINTLQYDIGQALDDEKLSASGIVIQKEMYHAAEEAAKEDVDISQMLKTRRILQQYSRYSDNIINLAIISRDGDVIQYDKYGTAMGAMWNEENHPKLMDAYAEVMERIHSGGKGLKYVVKTDVNIHSSDKNAYVFYVMYPIIGTRKTFDDVTNVLCVTYSMQMLDPFLKTVNKEEENMTVYMVDENDRIVYHDDKDMIGKEEKVYLNTSTFINEKKGIGGSAWSVAVAIDENKMQHLVNTIFYRGVGVYTALVLLFSIILFLVLRRTISPIKIVKREMDNISNGNQKQSIAIEGDNEIWELAKHFNRMMGFLEEQEQAVKYHHKEEIKALERQREAEIEALESQINAHFISNTLGAISYEAIEAGNYHISNMIKKLSNILRYTFDQSLQVVKLYREVEWTEQYLYLQKERFIDVFDYETDFDENFKEAKCCKLMMQPFIENAIVHGFEGWEEGGMIWITVEAWEEGWVLIIRDNGDGMNEEHEKKISGILDGSFDERIEDSLGTGVGILNAVARIKRFYGDDIAMKLETAPGCGTAFYFYVREEGRDYENFNSGR